MLSDMSAVNKVNECYHHKSSLIYVWEDPFSVLFRGTISTSALRSSSSCPFRV